MVEKDFEIKIRRLTVGDRKRLSDLIIKLTKEVENASLLNVISSAITSSTSSKKSKEKVEEPENKGAIKLGVKVVQLLLKNLEEETHEWFSDLIGLKNKEDFINLPIDTELIIIKQIKEASEANSFFTIASELYSMTKKFQNKFFGAKEE